MQLASIVSLSFRLVQAVHNNCHSLILRMKLSPSIFFSLLKLWCGNLNMVWKCGICRDWQSECISGTHRKDECIQCKQLWHCKRKSSGLALDPCFAACLRSDLHCWLVRQPFQRLNVLGYSERWSHTGSITWTTRVSAQCVLFLPSMPIALRVTLPRRRFCGCSRSCSCGE
jgi:hypothetical protein